MISTIRLGNETNDLRGGLTHEVTTWSQNKQLRLLRESLGSGFQPHLLHNSVLADIFGLRFAAVARARAAAAAEGEGAQKMNAIQRRYHYYYYYCCCCCLYFVFFCRSATFIVCNSSLLNESFLSLSWFFNIGCIRVRILSVAKKERRDEEKIAIDGIRRRIHFFTREREKMDSEMDKKGEKEKKRAVKGVRIMREKEKRRI